MIGVKDRLDVLSVNPQSNRCCKDSVKDYVCLDTLGLGTVPPSLDATCQTLCWLSVQQRHAFEMLALG